MTNRARAQLIQAGLDALPNIPGLFRLGRNGEALDTDEAAVWKRVLMYRVACWQQPARILETHGGLGISSTLYRYASRQSEIVSLTRWQTDPVSGKYDFVDIDPFGQPWGALERVFPYFHEKGVLMITNGEALAVARNFRKSQRYPTDNYGKRLPLWVQNEYLPKLEELTNLRVQFFYAFPSSIRAILSNTDMPHNLWYGCPQWMWWLRKYATLYDDSKGSCSTTLLF